MNGKTIYLAIIVAIVLFMGFVIYMFKREREYSPAAVKIGNITIDVEVANSPTKRARGLMNRENLEENAGMLFVFPTESKHRFWMANTLIPLDMIWISLDHEIVFIEQNVPPCTETGNIQALCKTYKPDSKAKFVLEVNGGWVEKNKVSVGQIVDLIEKEN